MLYNQVPANNVSLAVSILSNLGFGKPNQSDDAPQIAARALAYCPNLLRKADSSVSARMGSGADEFDIGMSRYTALGILLTFIYAMLSKEAVSHFVTMSVLDWAEKNGIEKSHVALIHARLKVNFDDSGNVATLGNDIRDDLAYISPQHRDVYSDNFLPPSMTQAKATKSA